MRSANRLSAIEVNRLNEPGLYPDGLNLYLQVKANKTKRGPSLSKSWILRYMRDGVSRDMGLGAIHTVSLKEARDRARIARQQLLDGIDPIDTRREAKITARLEKAKALTFQQCAEAYIAAHRATWKNPKHADQWPATLATYAYPIIGKLPVAAVDTALIIKILEPIWQTKPETATRVRGRIEAVLSWATVREYRRGDNPARWRGHLDKLLPARSKVQAVKHHPAMHYTALPGFMASLREQSSISARALEFTILTAARTGEVIGATWEEIDLDAKLWTVPAVRTKSGREHRVPLPDRAVAILKATPREKDNPHVFIGARKGKGLSNMSMLELLRGQNGDGLTVHGFRSTFRTWCAESTNYPREIAEAARAHVIRSATETAYQRGDAFEKRRRLMRDWAKHCEKPVPVKGEVLPMRVGA